jgi:sulfatase maturation enzyme AslB (radical SAM superfamily)
MHNDIRIRKESWGTIYYDNVRDEFSADVYEGFQPRPEAPIGIGWLVTAPCNLKCIHCYGNVEDLPRKALSTEQQLKVADRIIQAGVMRQILSGGEPLMRKDTPEVIEKLTSHGIATILGTNGTFLTSGIVKTIAKCTRVELSLDSMDERTNNEIRPSRNARGNTYRETIRAIKLCQDHGIRLRILTCLNKYNYLHVPEMADFFDELGIRDWAISWTLSAGRAHPIYADLMPEDTAHISTVVQQQVRPRHPLMQIRLSDRTVKYSRYYCLIWPDGTLGTEEIITGKKLTFDSIVTGTIADGWHEGNYDIDAHFKKWVDDRVRVISRTEYVPQVLVA